jgi:hypothetical protein
MSIRFGISRSLSDDDECFFPLGVSMTIRIKINGFAIEQTPRFNLYDIS